MPYTEVAYRRGAMRFLGIEIPAPPDSSSKGETRKRKRKRRRRRGPPSLKGKAREQALIQLNREPSANDAMNRRVPGSFENGKRR